MAARATLLRTRTAGIGALVLTTAALTGSAQPSAPPPPSLAAVIARVTAQPRYAHGEWSFNVRDRATGATLYAKNSNEMFTTGSILKVFSTATALHLYGPDYRFRTPVYRTGPVVNGSLRGNLILVASGDLSMGVREKPGGRMVYENAPQFDHTYANAGLAAVPIDGNPFAGVNQLAQQVRAKGIRRVDNVVIDARLFDAFNGWLDVQQSPASPIQINENRVDISTYATSVGRPARISWRPHTAAYRVVSTVRTVARGGNTDLNVTLLRPGVFQISGTIAVGSGRVLRTGDLPDPARFARAAFVQALRSAGVAVPGSAAAANPVRLLPPRGSYVSGRRVALHTSAKLSEFTKVILKVSHNPGADLMACLDAVKSGSRNCEDGLAAEARFVDSLDVPKDSVFIFDGAGSDERDRAAGASMTYFLRALDRTSIGPAFERSLSILGRDGDIADVFVTSPAAGKVRAKTGTRAGVAPSGVGVLTARTFVAYVTAKSGRKLVISVMVRDVPFRTFDDLFAIINDNASIAVAMQQAY